MNKYLFPILGFAMALATASCAPIVATREPISMSDYPADAYVGSNMLVYRGMRMALPDGWRFMHREKEEPKEILFWIRDTGGNAVIGNYRYTLFDFPVSLEKLSHVYAQRGMTNLEDKEIRKTEVGGQETYLVTGTNKEDGRQRTSALIQLTPRLVNEITLITDPGYLARNTRTVYGIINSHKIMPDQMSERRIKGSFSFKCDDGSMEWLDDIAGRSWESKGFEIIGKMGTDIFIIGIRQVSSTRFQDFFKTAVINISEFETELHLAGRSYQARAAGGDMEKNAKLALFFKHDGKDYLLDIFRGFRGSDRGETRNMHNDENILKVLNNYFYFDG